MCTRTIYVYIFSNPFLLESAFIVYNVYCINMYVRRRWYASLVGGFVMQIFERRLQRV